MGIPHTREGMRQNKAESWWWRVEKVVCGGGVKNTSENSLGDRMKFLEITQGI